MSNYQVQPIKPLSPLRKVKNKEHPAKRINIVSVKLVKESSLLYKDRSIRSP